MSQSARFSSKTYIRIGNHLRVKSSGVAPGLANARLPGKAKFANAPPPGLTRRANSPQWPWGGGGGAGRSGNLHMQKPIKRLKGREYRRIVTSVTIRRFSRRLLRL